LRDRPVRVLLAENTIRGLGGSYESLFITATSADRSRFEPIALFFQPNHFIDRLLAQGIRVIQGRSLHFWERPAYIEKSATLRSNLPRRGILGSARRSLVALLRAVFGGLPMAWTVRSILRRERIDILHCNNNLQRDAMMVLGARLAGVPVVAHERQLARCSLFARWMSRKVAVLICISDAVLEFARTSGCHARDRRRIYNAIDLTACRGVYPSLPAGPRRVGIVGRILPRKGQRHFIDAAARIRSKFPDVEFYIIGAATGDALIYASELKALAERLGIASAIRWTGYVEQPLPLVASLDVVVHAAIEPEPFGRVVLEAMALGRPVIATALGGPVEIIQDGISGFLVPPEDAEAIAQRVCRLFDDPGLGSRIRAGALRRAEEFSVEAYARQIGIVYDDALIASGKDPSFSKAAS